ncbi:MAG: hypothetical protein IJ225_11135 [Solobacterium sp.]|nr:hypothetical protein [Solobacterium sp.]
MHIWRQLSPQERKQYFLDYYLVKTLIGIAVLIFLVVLIRDLTAVKKTYALRIGVYDTSFTDHEKDDLIYHIQKTLNTAESVEIDDAYTSLNDQDLMRIVSRSTSGQLDVILADRTTFEYLAGYGYFKDLEQSASEEFLSIYSERLLYCAGLDIGEDGFQKENAEGNGELYAAGVLLEGTGLAEYLPDMEEPVMGVIYESEHLKQAEALLQLMGTSGRKE